MSTAAAEYERGEISDFRVKMMEERINYDGKLNDVRFSSMERLMSERFDRMQAVMEKNFAEYKAIAVDTNNELTTLGKRVERLEKDVEGIKDEISGLKGDVKAISTGIDTQRIKIGWYLTVFGIAVTIAISAIQLWK